MRENRQLKLCAFMRPAGIHTASWQYPGSFSDANFNFSHHKRFAQTLEHGKFDAIFLADHLAVLNMPVEALQRSATVASFDPLTLLPALAAVTEHIGLMATASTTYNEPYHIARKFASLDHISGGRAGWNVVTSANPNEALNFGKDEHLDHSERYQRGREFFDVVTGLWDSWTDDALIRNTDTGIFFDHRKVRTLNHRGSHFSVKGPLNIARPIQGWPVIVQAGASNAGRQLASEIAEVVFGASSDLSSACQYYADLKGRMSKAGRTPESLKVLPGCFVIVGDSLAEAQEKKARLDSLVHPESSIATLSVLLGTDISTLNLDSPLPELPETNASKSSRQKLVDLGSAKGLTVRKLAQLVGGSFGVLEMIGTPKLIADSMEEWFESSACDGFNVMFPYLPAGLDDFVGKVVPELQRRELFRRKYEGKTLRENLGLPRR